MMTDIMVKLWILGFGATQPPLFPLPPSIPPPLPLPPPNTLNLGPSNAIQPLLASRIPKLEIPLFLGENVLSWLF